MFQVNCRVPDPAVRRLAPAFEKLCLPAARVEQIATGFRWTEGPVWFGDARHLLWSDIPNNRIMKWDEESGAVSAYRSPSCHANGMTRDRLGRLIVCEHSGRRVTRTEMDGSITVLADSFDGKRLNSPNDVVVASDGGIWFTDPCFGIIGYFQGIKAQQELPEHVYRIDPHTGALEVMIADVNGPNGLAFCPHEKKLYVVQARSRPRTILAYAVAGDLKSVDQPEVLIDAQDGTPDGFRVDIDGNLWCGWGMGSEELDGVRVFSAQGEPIGHIGLPERCANLCFGGRHRNRLFMASSSSVYALFVNTQGVAYA